MKLIMNILMVLCTCLFFVSVALGAPHAVIEQQIYDFGTISQGKNADHVFIVRNTGNSPLTIGQISTSCGCTVANVSNRNIAPGKSAEIKSTFNSANFTGSITKTILVQTNDPKTPVYTLTIKGVVFEEIEVRPKQVNLGDIKAGIRKNVTVTVVNKGTKPLRLVSVKSGMPQAVAKAGKTKIRPGGKGYINIAITPGNTDRFLGGYLTIKTDSAVKPEIIIPVYASVVK